MISPWVLEESSSFFFNLIGAMDRNNGSQGHNGGSATDAASLPFGTWKQRPEQERKLTAILNKITIETFDNLSSQLIRTPVNSMELLDKLVCLLIDKAEMEHHFGFMYAQLARKLDNAATDGTWSTPGTERTQSFSYILITRMQKRFLCPQMDFVLVNYNAKEAEVIRRKKLVGHVQFLGELFKVGLIPEKVIHLCITQLISGWNSIGSQDMVEEHVELCIRLLSVVGKSLDNSPHLISKKFLKGYMDIFKHLTKLPPKGDNNVKCNSESLAETGPLSMRVQFSALNLLELKQLGWVPRRIESKAKKLGDIHTEARLEELSKTNKNAAVALQASQMKDTGEEDGWEVVGGAHAIDMGNSKAHQKKPKRDTKNKNKKFNSKKEKPAGGGEVKPKQQHEKLSAQKPMPRDKFITVSCATCDEWIHLAGDSTAQDAVVASFRKDLLQGFELKHSADSEPSIINASLGEGTYPKLSPVGTRLALFVEKTADHVLSNCKPATASESIKSLVELWNFLAHKKILIDTHIFAGLLPIIEFIGDIKADVPKMEEYFASLLYCLAETPDLIGVIIYLQQVIGHEQGYFHDALSSGCMGTVLEYFIDFMKGQEGAGGKLDDLIRKGFCAEKWCTESKRTSISDKLKDASL